MSGLDWDKEIEEQEKRELASKVQNIQLNQSDKPKQQAGASGDTKPAQPPPQPSAQPSSQPSAQPPADTPTDNATATEDNNSKGDDANDAESAADASLLNKALHNKLQESSQTQLDVQQNDPNSPLYSVKSFEQLRLKPNLLKGVYGMGFNAPSKIQETALPLLLADPPKNMIAQSQSGTGKTAAFVLTMLSRVDTNKNYPQAMCLAPTFELARQIGDVVEEMSKYITDLKIAYAIRGNRHSRGTKLTDHIVIGTPGTMLDWSLKFKFFDLSKVGVFVLDEADVMIATQGHQDQSIRIQRKLPPSCQMMLFSATYEDTVMGFAHKIVSDPVIIRLRREEESLSNIKQFYVLCSNENQKYEALANIYGAISIGQAIIFCHTKRTASWLAGKMVQDGHAVGLLSGELEITMRLSVLQRFKEGKERILITTNVMSRGIDIEQVTIVVNFDLPVDVNGQADCETYLHRIGRTGRFGKNGLAINFVDRPKSMEVLQQIERHFGRKILLLSTDDTEELEKIV
ncbi:ATP-dependent RNA helicase DDX19A-like [Asterias rubens]|uniref:ATP-dependent RNA helicase DDX19A-like n=1 Tax=Asterias rubens TaxID=7604 RepID=UPI001455D066|nr:ATP-dependent RNA helicase DDX19A-like [Asterias rubens]